jgi:hypothetical protein
MEKFVKCTIQTGCLYSGSAHPDRRGPGPSQPFGPRQSHGRLSPPSEPMACRQNPASWRPVVGGGVAREQAGRVADWIGGRGEGGGGHRKACPRRRGSAAGEGRRQAGVGVTGGVRAVREEVLSATMLGVGSRWSERGQNGLSAVA